MHLVVGGAFESRPYVTLSEVTAGSRCRYRLLGIHEKNKQPRFALV